MTDRDSEEPDTASARGLDKQLDDMRKGIVRPPAGQAFLLSLCAGMLGFVVLNSFPRWVAITGGLTAAVLAYLYRAKP